MIAGIILAAGKGTRIKIKGKNKVALSFLNKPLITYAVELFRELASPLIVVIGAYHESVRQSLKKYDVVFAMQKKRLGTGHAVKIGLKALDKQPVKPTVVLVGYGDHTMFYKKKTINDLIKLHLAKKAVMSLITTVCDDSEKLAWGRIVRDNKGYIVSSVEQKDADEKTLAIKELNAGFYCFDFNFLTKNLQKLKKSPVSGEYYINGLVDIAVGQGRRVVGLKVPFVDVGIGINRKEEVEESQKLFLKKSQ